MTLRCAQLQGPCLLAAVILSLAGSPARAMTWHPELGFETRYDDNVFHRPEGADDIVTAIVPGLTLLNRDPITSYEAIGRTGFTLYARSKTKTTRRDVTSLWVQHRPGRFERFEGRARYVQTLDPLDFERGTVTTRGQVTAASASGNAEFYRAGGTVGFNRWDYAAGNLADGSALDWTARLYPVNTETSTLAVSARRRDLRVRDALSLEASYQTLSLRRRHSKSVSTEYEVGRVEVDYHDGAPRRTRPVAAFGFRRAGHEPEAPLTLRFRVADDIATTLNAGADYSLGGRAISLDWETAVDADGGLYRIATLTRRGALTARDTLYSGQIVDAGASFGRTRPLHGDGPRVDIWRASVGVSMPVGQWITGRLGWDYLRQDAPVGGTAVDFDRNRYSLAMVASIR